MAKWKSDSPIYLQAAAWAEGEIKKQAIGSDFYSQRDLAGRLGIAYNTAGRALNELVGRGLLIREVGRGTVVQARERSATRLSQISEKGRRLLLIYYDVSSHYLWDLVRKFESRTLLGGFHLETLKLNRQSTPEDVITFIEERNLDGLALLPMQGFLTEPFLVSLTKLGFPVVLLCPEEYSVAGIYWVSADYENGAFQCTEALIQKGHRKIAMVSTEAVASVNRQRIAGMKRSLYAHGIKLRDLRRFSDPRKEVYKSSYVEGSEKVRELMRDYPDTTAIFFDSDAGAYGGMFGLWEMGIEVPHQVSIVAEGDMPSSAFTIPPLSTLRHDRETMVQKAFAVLEGRSREISVRVPGHFMERRSIREMG